MTTSPTPNTELRDLIETAWSDPSRRSDPAVVQAVFTTVGRLDAGTVRVASPPAEPGPDGSAPWEVHAWVKQAVLLYFGLQPMEQLEAGPLVWHDKIPTKKNFRATGVRAVRPGVVL